MLVDFNHGDFEEFLKKSSDGLRMHPSDKVWNSVSKRLHQRRRRLGFISGSFFMVASLLGYLLIQNKDVVKPLATRAITNSIKSSLLLNEGETTRQNVIAQNGDVSPGNMIYGSERETALIIPLYTSLETKKDSETPQQSLQLPEILTPAEPVSTSIIDSDPQAKDSEESFVKKEESAITSDNIPTIESVTNTYKRIVKKNKLSFQVFFTPTVSYRKLSENKAYLNSVPQTNATINYAVLYNVNDAVTHKPDMGLELGFTAKYVVAKNVKLRAGLQFNMSRYDIKAFTYPTEVAQIALNNSNFGVDYVGATTNYRNFGGGTANWLQNMYFQLSTPVGAELKLAGNDKTSFGVAGTVQPTYVLGDRAYMISTDYKNYTEVPWLIRRWNVNTSFETFVSYSTGKMKWQVGPQVRYQMLSSFVTKYPVRENLFDFGLKIGVSLNADKKSSDNNQ